MNKLNPYAYQGKLTCPFCESSAQRYIEHVSPLRLRYRCRKCGLTYQYDISNRSDINPYASYQGGSVWRNIQKVLQGRTLKGRMT